MCSPRQILVLPKDRAIPVCQDNPCHARGPGFVQYRNQCYKLDERGPCQLALARLAVNEVTLEVDCVIPANLPSPPKVSTNVVNTLGMRYDTDEEKVVVPVVERACHIGGRRNCTEKPTS